MPEPMPVVMQEVVPEGAPWSWALPQVVVDSLGHRGCLPPANGGAVARVPRLGEIRAAQKTAANLSDRLLHPGPAPTLVAHLHQAAVLAGRGDHPFSFTRIMAARFLDVNMFAGGTGQNRRGRMPVVARGDHQRIDCLIIKNATEVSNGSGELASHLANGLRSLREAPLIYIANVGNRHVWLLCERLRESQTTAAVSHDSHHELVHAACSRYLASCRRKPQAQSRGGGDTEELPTVHRLVHPSTLAAWDETEIARTALLAQDGLDRPISFFHEPHRSTEYGDFHLLVVQSHLAENRGVQIAVIMPVFDRLVTDVVGGAVNDAAFHSAAGKPDSVATWIMVAPRGVLGP